MGRASRCAGPSRGSVNGSTFDGAFDKVRIFSDVRIGAHADYMFSGCANLKSADMTLVDTSLTTSAAYMFSGCRNLVSVQNVGITSTPDTASGRVSPTNLYTGDGAGRVFSGVSFAQNGFMQVSRSVKGMFEGADHMRSVRLTNSLNSAALADASSMFSGCAELITVELNNVANGTSLTNVASMFAGATSSAAIAGEDTRYSVSNFATARTVNATSAFANMTRLKTFVGTDMVRGGASTLTGAFAGAQSLTNLTLTNVGTGTGAILTGAFRGSLALRAPATTLDPEPDYLPSNTSAT